MAGRPANRPVSYVGMQIMCHGDAQASVDGRDHEGAVFLTVRVQDEHQNTNVTFSGHPDNIERLVADLAAARSWAPPAEEVG